MTRDRDQNGRRCCGCPVLCFQFCESGLGPDQVTSADSVRTIETECSVRGR